LIHDLLELLKKNCHPELPLTATTLFKRDEPEDVTEMVVKIMGDGEYFHFGVQRAFQDWNFPIPESIEIDIFTNGFPISKSSKLVGWPILGAVVNQPNNPIFIFGMYADYGSPKYSDVFLEDFANEV
jgi:hypothetical protein